MKKLATAIIMIIGLSLLVACNETETAATNTTEYSDTITEEVAEEATEEVAEAVEATEEVAEEAEVTEAAEEAAEEAEEVTEEVTEATEEVAEEVTEEVAEATPEVAEAKPVTKPVVQSISAKVNGNHAVGDTLSAADFTISVNMTDGSTIKNPAGWTADKLVLDSENTVINVAYNGMTTSVNVKATAAQQAQQPAAPVQETPAQPAATGGRPASSTGAVTDAAISDLAGYAQSRGWAISKNGYGYTIFQKNGYYMDMRAGAAHTVIYIGDVNISYYDQPISFAYNYIESK